MSSLVWRDLLTMGGMVRGTRENVRALMRDGQNIMVFPGGTGEVFKGRGQDYQLMWGERLGFARLAIEFGYPIVPFAAVGAEEMLHVVVDRGTPIAAQVSALMRRMVGVPLPPIPRGIGVTPLPRPATPDLPVGPTGGHQPIWWRGRTRRSCARDSGRGPSRGPGRHPQMPAEPERDPHRGLLARLWHEAHEVPRLAANDPDALAGQPRVRGVERARSRRCCGVDVTLGAAVGPAGVAWCGHLARARARARAA